MFLLAALTSTTGHGAPKPPGPAAAPVIAQRPEDTTPDAPRPPFIVTTEVRVASTAAFDAARTRTTHHLAIAAPPYAGATLELTADGAFGTTNDRALASAENVIDAEAAAAGADCRPAAGSTIIPAGDFDRMTSDGLVDVTVRNSASVTPRCASNRHTVVLRYEAVASRLEFPPTRVGSSTSLAVTLHPRGGHGPIALTLSSDRAGFAPAETRLVLPADGTSTTAIRFAPVTAGPLAGTLTIAAEGSPTPVSIPLTGLALDPPPVGVDPDTLDVTLPVGGSTLRSVQVTNLGTRGLDLAASIEGSAADPGAPSSCTTPAVYVLEGVTGALARVDLDTGDVTHIGPEIFGASSLALTSDASAAYVTTFSGEVYRLDTVSGARQQLAGGLAAVHDSALSADGAILYLLHRDAATIERFDTASFSAAPLADHLPFPTRLDLDEAHATLLVASGAGLLALDTGTGATLATYPELKGTDSPRLDAATGLVFVHNDAARAIQSFDRGTRRLQTIALLSGSGVSPFALASHGRLAYGLDPLAQSLSRVDLQDGQVTPLTSDLTSVRDVAVDADADCLGTFLTVSPKDFSLQPNETTTITARLSALGARTGRRAASIRLREAGLPVVLAGVDARLEITSAPHLALDGAPRTIEQVVTDRIPAGRGTTVTFDLQVPDPPVGGGTLAITTEAALAGAVGVSLEGTVVGGDLNPQCVRTTHEHEVTPSLLAAAAADGTVTARLDLQDLEDFAVPCGSERFTARLAYAGPADRLDFGEVEAGTNERLDLLARNTGDQPLLVTTVSVSGAGFSTTAAPLSLPPGSSAPLPILFTATGSGASVGTLRLETNDPGAAVVEIPLSATSVMAPVSTFSPSGLFFESTPGNSSVQDLVLGNDGDTDLDYDLTVVGSDPACPAETLVTSRLGTIDLATLEQGALPQGLNLSHAQIYGMSSERTGAAGFAAVGAGAGGILQIDLASGGTTRLRGLSGALAVALEPGEATLLVTDAGERLYRFDRGTSALDRLGTGPLGGHVAVDPGGTTAYLTTKSGLVQRLDLASGAIAPVASGLVSPQGIALTPDGSAAYVIEVRPGDPAGDRLSRVDLAGGTVTPLLAGLEGAEEIALDPAGTHAYLSEERAGRIIAVELATGQSSLLAQPLPSSGLVLMPRAGCSGGFLSPPPRHGTVPKRGSAQLSFSASAQHLTPGHYTATVAVHGNDPLRPLTRVPVVFDVLPDADADGVADRDDNCPQLANDDQADGDGDHRGNACDNCPAVANPDQEDVNADGAGDACQPDVAFLDVRQDGGAFVVVRLALQDPLGLPLAGEVSFFDAATGAAPRAVESEGTAPRVPVVGGSASGIITTRAAGASPVFSVPFAGRPPRRIDLSPLLASHAYRLRVTASNGTSLPFVAETVFTHQAEGTLAFNEPPVARLAAAASLECDRPGGALASLSGTTSTDGDSTPGTTDDLADYAWTLDPGTPAETALGHGPALDAFVPLGTHLVSLRVTDQLGETSEATAPLGVVDTRAPEVAPFVAEPAVLFPPNHDLVPVQVHWQVSDVCDPHPAALFAGASSSEPDDAPGNGDGATIGDIGPPSDPGSPGGTGALVLPLRAERSASGSGRVYVVRVRATDASLNSATALATVVVPHDLGHGPEPLLLMLERNPGSPGIRIDWPALAAGAAYDVLSGDLSAWRVEDRTLRLGSMRVLARGTTATSLVDTGAAPLPGRATVYLIQAHAAGLVTGYGTESAPWPRVPTSCDGGCP